MNSRFTLSVCLNIALLATLGLLWLGNRREADPAMPAVASPAPVVNPLTASANLTPSPAVVAPFRWSMLESTDYRAYIRNLRNIECPEPTIRDIITADLHSLYNRRRDKVRQELATDSVTVEPHLRQELASLDEEEKTVLAELLGPVPDSSFASEAPPATHSEPQPAAVKNQTVSMPLVFSQVNPKDLNLDEKRIQAIQNLQQQFMSSIGGDGMDPSDPLYLERWQQAQPRVDRLLRGLIGMHAYQQYDMAARRQAASPQ